MCAPTSYSLVTRAVPLAHVAAAANGVVLEKGGGEYFFPHLAPVRCSCAALHRVVCISEDRIGIRPIGFIWIHAPPARRPAPLLVFKVTCQRRPNMYELKRTTLPPSTALHALYWLRSTERRAAASVRSSPPGPRYTPARYLSSVGRRRAPWRV